MYDFRNVTNWKDVAIQALTRVGWRPDCAVSQDINIQKAIPPDNSKAHFVIYTLEHMRDIPLGGGHPSYNAWLASKPGGLHIKVGAFFQHGLGYGVAWIRDPNNKITVDTWIMGYDNTNWNEHPPVSVIEGSLLHALRLVERYSGNNVLAPKYIAVNVGNQETQNTLLKWFNKGDLDLMSGFATEIIRSFRRLVAAEFECTAIFRDLPESFFEDARLTGESSPDVIYATALRVNKEIGPQVWKRWGEQIARLPWTTQETKTKLKNGYIEDELRAIDMLKEVGSTACSIYKELALTRPMVKEALRELRNSRACQVALAKIACATRFKFFDENRGFPVRCTIKSDCNEEDSFPHLLRCAGLEIPTTVCEETIVQFSVKMATQTVTENPGMPNPIKTVREGEFEIELPPSPARTEGELSLDC